jgi:protein-S-isoprenylcysteine O-methyltransferase Ste14
MLKDQIGDWLEWQRRKAGAWFKALVAALALLVVFNVFIHPHTPHFGLDKWPGFWAVFGLVGAVGMTLVLKKGVMLIIGKSEDYYDRDK